MDDEHVQLLRRAFTMFDSNKSGKIEREKVRLILNTLGYTYDDSELDRLLSAEDTEGIGTLTFDEFCRVAVHFSEEDDEALQKELKEAFRLYDKEGNGYIPTSSLREILAALDDQLTGDQLNEMIAEIDTDSSGTVDFDEFQEFMSLERDHEYYEQVDNDKEDIYDCPILNAQMQNAIKKKDDSSASGSKFRKPRRPKVVSHPTNQNG
ncbi:troponin C-like isoform X2 [Chironomus tepperi]